jgi:hypothetical protein
MKKANEVRRPCRLLEVCQLEIGLTLSASGPFDPEHGICGYPPVGGFAADANCSNQRGLGQGNGTETLSVLAGRV